LKYIVDLILIVKENIQYFGYFSLPFYGEKFFGILNISDGGKIELELTINDIKQSHGIFNEKIELGSVGVFRNKKFTASTSDRKSSE